MKKFLYLFLLLVIFISAFFVGTAMAADVTLTLRWRQNNLDRIAKWTLYYGTHSGGPYDQPPVDIAYDQSAPTYFEVDRRITVPDDKNTTFYFILVSVDVDGQMSQGGSDEFSYTFKLEPPPPPPPPPYDFEITGVKVE